jgi:hypothetical protein
VVTHPSEEFTSVSEQESFYELAIESSDGNRTAFSDTESYVNKSAEATDQPAVVEDRPITGQRMFGHEGALT